SSTVYQAPVLPPSSPTRDAQLAPTRPSRPAPAVAVKITRLPASPLAVARAVSVRSVVPRVQEVAVATPLPSVVTGVGGSTVPFAPVALNVTATPETGFPFASFTITEGGELGRASARH